MARITKTIFLTAAEAAVYKSTGTCQHVTPDGDTITVSDTDTDCIVYCPEDEPATKAELAEAVKHHYSTTEQVVGTWIDGKPIYEKTIDCNHLELTTNVWIDAFSVAALNIDQLVGHKIIGTYQSGQCDLGNNELMTSRITPDKSTFQIWKSNYTATLDYVVLQYTKTTD